MKKYLLLIVGAAAILGLASTFSFSKSMMDDPWIMACEGPEVDQDDPSGLTGACDPKCDGSYSPETCPSPGSPKDESGTPSIEDRQPGPGGEDPCDEGGATGNPVDFYHGHKTEKVVDLRVPLPGIDFVFSRKYMSTPEYSAAPLLGEKWAGSSFRFIDFSSATEFDCCQARSSGGFCGTVVLICCTPGDPFPEKVRFPGSTSQYYLRSALDGVAVWTLVEPGQWEIDFYRELETNDIPGATEMDAMYIGLVAEMRDAYGNRHEYEYGEHGHEPDNVLRLKKVRFRDASGSPPIGYAEFSWWINPLSPDRLGRLDKIVITRGTTEVMSAHYTYAKDDTPHLGTTNDLIQVHVRELVDNGWRSRITQYRYHNESYTPPGSPPQYTMSGSNHQLKLIINPEQIEFYAQRRAAADGVSAKTLEEYAAELMELEDEENESSPGTTLRPVDLASKIVSQYETGPSESGRVLEQFLVTDCGCSGGAAGTRLTYDRFDWEKEIVGEDDVPGRTTRMTKWVGDGVGGWDAYQVTYYDMLLHGPPAVGDWERPAYLVNKAIEDPVTQDRWVTHNIYSDDDRNLLRTLTPEAVGSYSPSTGQGVAPQYTAGSQGLVWSYKYSDDNRRIETRVGDGFLDTALDDLDSFTSYTLLTRVKYGLASGTDGEWNTDNSRPHLVRSIERFRDENATDPETTQYFYGFYSSGETAPVAWRETRHEAESASQNGPGGWITSYSLYDELGNEFFSFSADSVLTKREFHSSGRVSQVVRNSPHYDVYFENEILPPCHAGDDPGCVGGLDTSGWTDRWTEAVGTLTTEYDRDLLGRVQKRRLPGFSAIETYTKRQMLEYPDRPGIEYYAEVALPHRLGSANDYDGPATITWYNAANKVIGSREYVVDLSGSYGWSYDIPDVENHVGRRVIVHDHTGRALSVTQWHNVQENLSATSTFAYDKLGRLSFVIDDNGTVTRQQYDVHDRVVEVEMGIEGATAGEPDESTMKRVARYFYDHELDGTIPVQGVGNGNLTLVVQDVDATATRSTEYRYDFRGRRTWTINPLPPHQYTVYDNRNRPIRQALYTSSPTGQTPPAVTDRGSYTEIDYSQRGLTYRQAVAINPSSATPDFLESHSWYDPAGRSVAQLPPNGPMTKTQYDPLGRPTITYTIGGVHQSYADVFDVATWEVVLDDQEGEPVVEQVEYSYLTTSGRLALVTTRQRMHDVATGHSGPLDGSDAITTFAGINYDNAGRRIRSINYGTRRDFFETGGTAPSSLGTYGPSFGANDLVTVTAYDTRGRVASVTDPEDQVTAYRYDDLGQRIAVIENLKGDPSIAWATDRWQVTYPANNPVDENRVTSFVYDGVGNLIKQVAHQPGTAPDPDFVQETLYNYGVTTSDSPLPSTINSFNLLREVVYPDGQASSIQGDRTVTFGYNRLGEVTHMRDQNGTVHEYLRDAFGRVTSDRVTTFGSTDIDQAIDKIATQFDDLGRLSVVRSYSGVNVANAVEFTYTGFGQVHKVIQDPFGDNTSAMSREVVYGYDEEPFTSGNRSRLASLGYPSTGTLNYNYGTAGRVNSRISRVEAIDIYGALQKAIGYHYIGMGMTAVVDYREPDVQLDRTAEADGKRNFAGQTGTAGAYPGYDRFGRVVRHMWVDGEFQPHHGGSLHSDSSKPHVPPIYELTHTHDKASNRLTRSNDTGTLAWGYWQEEFDYDGLHRVKEAKRGDGTDLDASSRNWTLDMLGNWEETKTWNGSAFSTEETRVHSDANELTSRTVGIDSLNLTHDKAGNLNGQEALVSGLGGMGPVQIMYTYDAWNRLVRVKYGTSTRAEYQYNGLNWRTVKRADISSPPNGTLNQQRLMYYNGEWQLLEEFINDDWDIATSQPEDHDRRMQYIWGVRYIDDIALRRQFEAEGQYGPGTVTSTWYHLTDTLFSTVAIINEYANLVERVSYDAYGNARHHRLGDLTGDGATTSADQAVMDLERPAIYGVGDLNRDGVVDATDELMLSVDLGPALPAGKISQTDNIIGYAGYVFNAEIHGGGLYTVRHRHYSPELGRWFTRDPLGYVDGMGLYEYVRGRPNAFRDPHGLSSLQDWEWGPFPGDYLPPGHHGPVRPWRPSRGNCYRFACDDPWDFTPGRHGVNPGGPKFVYDHTCDTLKQNAIDDGMVEVCDDGDCPPGTTKVAYARTSDVFRDADGSPVIIPGHGPFHDYHWWREVEPGRWKHKPGGTPVRDFDEDGNPIVDPGKSNNGQWDEFCGYLCAPDNMDLDGMHIEKRP